jgi:uncharacterized membrane protein
MNELVLTAAPPRTATADGLLSVAARAWFLIAVFGQWIFAAYLTVFFGGAALEGDFARWNDELPRGYAPGHLGDNAVVATHLAFALVALVGGPLQFIDTLRARFPRLHRWNGRVYLVAAALTSLAGLYVIVTRGTVGDLSLHVAMCFNTLLILCFAGFAWRAARERDFEMHRVWVLRLFMAVGGVWFFRVGLMFWLAVNQEAIGFDLQSFSGPFITFLGFAQTLLPLAALQLFLVAERSRSVALRYGAAGVIAVLTVAMSFGVYVAANRMWLPHL